MLAVWPSIKNEKNKVNSTEGKYQSFDIKKETMPTSKSESYHKYIEHFLNAASYMFFLLIYLKIKQESMIGVR